MNTKTTQKHKAYRIFLNRVEGSKFELYAILIDKSHYQDIWHEADKILDDWRKTVPPLNAHRVEFEVFFNGANSYKGSLELLNSDVPNIVNHITEHCNYQAKECKNKDFEHFLQSCDIGG